MTTVTLVLSPAPIAIFRRHWRWSLSSLWMVSEAADAAVTLAAIAGQTEAEARGLIAETWPNLRTAAGCRLLPRGLIRFWWWLVVCVVVCRDDYAEGIPFTVANEQSNNNHWVRKKRKTLCECVYVCVRVSLEGHFTLWKTVKTLRRATMAASRNGGPDWVNNCWPHISHNHIWVWLYE